MTGLPAAMARGLGVSLCAVVPVLPMFVSAAIAHPHDILAQCQLQDGSWKMCDQVIHDPSTGKHVPKAAPAGIDSLTAPLPPEPPPEPPRRLQIQR